MHNLDYDIIVVGAGHAGCEAAAIAANMGSRVLLITSNMQTIAQMSCNPAMGGIAKGQIVREIDALGGYSGMVSDKSMIQFRMLNKSKGPAMWSPRTQNDRMLFALTWREHLEKTDRVFFYQDAVNRLLVDNDKVIGVHTARGNNFFAKAVILTNGTFLNGIIHIGEQQSKGGRLSENAAYGITEQLVELGFETDRLKTGTPPRVDGRSLDYTKMEKQDGDTDIVGFSYQSVEKIKPEQQKCCYITYTNEKVHDILKTGFDKSPMFTGRIEGVGPRYCPSIEDKINRFADRNRHQLFVEPEGWNTVEIYVNGFSTSLPEEVQLKALQAVPGFEHCRFFRPGYAIEYDYFPPIQLTYTLETKKIENLYCAGQINGTTGYEEAACQGLVAGINAHLKINQQKPFILSRSQAYIGVLIDDLVCKGTDEPYRMFTSRAEFRTLLRQDNADMRLTGLGFEIGTISKERHLKWLTKKNRVEEILLFLQKTKVSIEDTNTFLQGIQEPTIMMNQPLAKLLLRPHVSIQDLMNNFNSVQDMLGHYSLEELEQASILLKYERYIEKEKELVAKMETLECTMIPENFDYTRVQSLSNEAKQKFIKIKPTTLGQASRISGVNPSDIQILMVYMGR
ncbi:MAG: tRNA uridine-5-carboxymethylaminomethyl(34) synthesis enzyme MnmG [Phycisphaerales bacterium]|nr:tRNA uridine-5-carboxymethylaminomethyl(34) synthesis enzyme MnmG [Phycisphaerales bacterium]